MKTLPQHTRNQQQGTVLIIALIFLLILTLLGVSAMDGTLLETRLAANSEERNIAFQMAEMGVLQGLSEVQQGNLSATTPTRVDRSDNISAVATIIRKENKGCFLPQRGSGDGNKVGWRYFEIESQGQSAAQEQQNPARTTLHIGGYQEGSKCLSP